MIPAGKYAGFLDHIQRYLGRIRDGEPPTVGGDNRGYALFFLVSNTGNLVSVATNGIRYQAVRIPMPQEYVCTVHARHERAAHILIAMTAEHILRVGSGLALDQVVLAETPLIPDSEIHGVIASTHPYADGEVETLLGPDGEVELQLLTLIPVTAAEGDLARQHGPDALYSRWEEQESDLLDLYRPSAV